MTVIDDQGRPGPPETANEFDTLLGFLDFQRATLEWKTSGLDADGFCATLLPTTMTLGGLLKHMAVVEEYWFAEQLLGADDPWTGVDWDADPDWDWRTSGEDSPDYLRALWSEKVSQSRVNIAGIMANGGLDSLAAVAGRHGQPSLRWILVHMIEEYARHNGHADLLRESIDGQTGE